MYDIYTYICTFCKHNILENIFLAILELKLNEPSVRDYRIPSLRYVYVNYSARQSLGLSLNENVVPFHSHIPKAFPSSQGVIE